MDRNLAKYYAERASEYDKIYLKPERQEELGILSSELAQLLAKRKVLEVACGTGYWTQFVAPNCVSITATDYNTEVLDIAKERLNNFNNISFKKSDAFKLNNLDQDFNGALAGFWWSHLKKVQISNFLSVLHSKLLPGSIVVIADNNYVEGSSTPISREDQEGNTYQIRRLDNGSEQEILKNFTNEQSFFQSVLPFSDNTGFMSLKYFWYGWYVTKA